MKKIIALFMSAVLLVSCAVTGVSAADNDTSPVIVVSGVGTRGFYKDYGTENEVSVFPPTVHGPPYWESIPAAPPPAGCAPWSPGPRRPGR